VLLLQWIGDLISESGGRRQEFILVKRHKWRSSGKCLGPTVVPSLRERNTSAVEV